MLGKKHLSADSAAGRTSALHEDINNIDAEHNTDVNVNNNLAVVKERNASVLSEPLELGVVNCMMLTNSNLVTAATLITHREY